jgi:hypothetical protein
MSVLKSGTSDRQWDKALAGLEKTGNRLTCPSREALTRACQQIADEYGFGKAVESVIALSRKLGFLIADPQVDSLRTIEIPLPDSRAVCRLEANPNRAHRGDVKKLIERGIINPEADNDSWMYEKWPNGCLGHSRPLSDGDRGWGKNQPGAIKCFLCSGLGEGRENPVNPNEIFISCPGPDGVIHAGCNFAALAPCHMTTFASASTQQRIDGATPGRTLAILDALQEGCDPAEPPFTVIHNGDLACRIDEDGKVKMIGAGATLVHDHNQFMRADLPILHAAVREPTSCCGVKTGIVDWPSSIIRLEAPAGARQHLVSRAHTVIRNWQQQHAQNTANLIATSAGEDTVLLIALRRVGMADAPGKTCVASLEQSGIIVLDDMNVFEKYVAASPAERLAYLRTVLESVDPVFADARGDPDKRLQTLRKTMGV